MPLSVTVVLCVHKTISKNNSEMGEPNSTYKYSGEDIN